MPTRRANPSVSRRRQPNVVAKVDKRYYVRYGTQAQFQVEFGGVLKSELAILSFLSSMSVCVCCFYGLVIQITCGE